MIKVKKNSPYARIPTRERKESSILNLYADLEGGSVVIQPHSTVPIGTGLLIGIPEGFTGFIFARADLAVKEGLRPASCIGLIGPNYREEIVVTLHNDTNEAKMIASGDKIAKLIVMETPRFSISEVSELA